ncbi:MAG: hypothetical protein IJL39_00150 [Clostridia bacterium]|nr:hypothetical protein [Clostridia bacterium]
MGGFDIGALTGAACALLGGVLSYVAFLRNNRVDADKSGREIGTVLTELRYIKDAVNDANRKLDEHEKENRNFGERLTAVEASTKSAHHRIDALEGRQRGAGT